MEVSNGPEVRLRPGDFDTLNIEVIEKLKRVGRSKEPDRVNDQAHVRQVGQQALGGRGVMHMPPGGNRKKNENSCVPDVRSPRRSFVDNLSEEDRAGNHEENAVFEGLEWAYCPILSFVS